MNLEARITAFAELGKNINEVILSRPVKNNSWFTAESLKIATEEISEMLKIENLNNWTANYAELNDFSDFKTVAVIMAGNIPLVGFHDFLSVLISGHSFLGKLSSKDDKLLPAIASKLIEIEPGFKNKIKFTDERLKGFDAVIATGSDNSARYFEYYFGKHPNLIRKNRHSVAVITGEESSEDYEKLADDVFIYFGMGCRSVSKLFLPEGFDIQRVFEPMLKYENIINHNKYANNYDYHRAIFLMNTTKFWDNGFITLTESESLGSPVSVLFFEYYKNLETVKAKLEADKDKLQCVVSLPNIIEKSVAFGETQHPQLNDYADNADTIKFLLGIPEASKQILESSI